MWFILIPLKKASLSSYSSPLSSPLPTVDQKTMCLSILLTMVLLA